MTIIATRGKAERYERAERATVSARIRVEDRNREASVASASTLHNDLLAQVEQLRKDGSATWHSAEPISTWEYDADTQNSVNQKTRIYVTTSTVQVKLSDLDLVSELVTELALRGISASVDWSLTTKRRRELEQEIRGEAVANARAVADDYATALGEKITRVVHLTQDSAAGGGGHFAVRAAAAPMGDSFESAEVTIPDITVSSSVLGEFET